MKRLLFFISLVFTASSLFANSPNQQNSEIEKYFNAWKDFLTQYDEILENYEASSPKAQALEKKVLFSYKIMHEAFSALYVRSSRMYKKQLDSGVKRGAPMVKGLESRIENLKTIGRRMKPSLDIDQQKELLQWMTEKNFPQKISESSQKSGEVSVKKHNPGVRMVKKINGVDFAFRWCPPGTFTMGLLESESRRPFHETQHQVTLSKGFWIMETEVTQRQWQAVMGYNPSHFKDDNCPVENVSWDECQAFCRKTELQIPTEAQWEYACRAGKPGLYAGNIGEMAWFKSNSGKRTHPVGTKRSNAWGLFDMYGNVYEWCQDWEEDYSGDNETDPTGPEYGVYRVHRGGCWAQDAEFCKSGCRNGREPNDPAFIIGFRCVIVE